MTSPLQVDIRLPSPIRIYVCGFLVVWVGLVVWMTMIAHHGSSIIVGAVFVVFGCILGYRVLRLGVRSDGSGVLHVHNHFGTRQLSRDEVEQFRVSTNGGRRFGQRGVQVLLRDGTTYGLDVCRAQFGVGVRRLSNQVDQLNVWLHTR